VGPEALWRCSQNSDINEAKTPLSSYLLHVLLSTSPFFFQFFVFEGEYASWTQAQPGNPVLNLFCSSMDRRSGEREPVVWELVSERL
jgi:hypothetical protein